MIIIMVMMISIIVMMMMMTIMAMISINMIMMMIMVLPQGFCAPSHDDKLMEVVAVSGLTSIATAKVLGIQNSRLRQCRVARLTVSCKEPVAMQVDGEAWLQHPGTIIISHKNKARMLFKDKHFTQTLETWKQKSSNNITATPSTPLHETLSVEDLDHYKELAASIPPLIG